MVTMNDKKTVKEMDILQRYYLSSYLYSGSAVLLREASQRIDLSAWDSWHCVILVESSQSFFEVSGDELCKELEDALHRHFYYMNLNTRQSLLFFYEQYCDYTLIANNMYICLKQKHAERLYLAVSAVFEGREKLPGILRELEEQMEERFHHPDVHVFPSLQEKERFVNEETRDSQLMQLISEDIGRRDADLLKKHFSCLAEKYQKYSKFSAMYVKFVFSNVIQELFQEKQFALEQKLERDIDELYASNDIRQILQITGSSIERYEAFLIRSVEEARETVDRIREYIHSHCGEDLTIENLAVKAQMAPDYFAFVFKKITGMNLHRCIRICRMEKARDLFSEGVLMPEQISRRLGFASTSYFCRSYREYFGVDPCKCRDN